MNIKSCLPRLLRTALGQKATSSETKGSNLLNKALESTLCDTGNNISEGRKVIGVEILLGYPIDHTMFLKRCASYQDSRIAKDCVAAEFEKKIVVTKAQKHQSTDEYIKNSIEISV